MSVIYEYTLNSVLTTLQMPFGAKVLTVGVQNENICLWAEVDPARAPQTRQFMAVPTGLDAYLDGLTYVGTVFLEYLVWGYLVLHIYEQT